MRILIISVFFPPVNSIASLRPYSWAKHWSRAGHDVTVLTVPKQTNPASDLPLSKEGFRLMPVAPKFNEFFQRWKKSYHTGEMTIPTTVFKQWKSRLVDCLVDFKNRRGVLRLCRMPDTTDLWVKPTLNAIQNEKPWDLVVSTSGPYTTHLIAHKLKKREQAHKWIADFRDPWSDNKILPGLFPFTIIERALERRLMVHADVITTVSPILKNTLGEKHGLHKTHVIENGIDPEDFLNIDPAPYFPADGKYRIVHTGSIYEGINNPFPLVQAIQELGHAASHIEVIFAGISGLSLPREIVKHNLSHIVKFIPTVSRDNALRMQRDADALLFLPFEDIEKNGILSGKIFEYLYWGNKTIAVGGTSNKCSIQLLDGITIEPNFGCDVSKIKRFLIEKTHRQAIVKSKANQEVIKRFSRATLAEKMLHL